MGKYRRKSPHYTIHGKEKVPLTRTESVDAAKRLHKNAYKCPECEWFHVGSESKALVREKKNMFINDNRHELGDRVARALSEENFGNTQDRLKDVENKIRSAASRRMAGLGKV